MGDINWKGKDRIWRQYVKEVENTTTHPGYRYKFFSDEDDANRFFIELLGENWQDQEWAKFLTKRSEEALEVKVRRQAQYRTFDDYEGGRLENFYISKPNNYEYQVMLMVKNGVTSTMFIIEKLHTLGYRTEHNRVQFYVNKYKKIYKRNNPSKEILIEFIRFYAAKGMSSRKIEQALTKDNIFISYRHIQNLMNELKGEQVDELL